MSVDSTLTRAFKRLLITATVLGMVPSAVAQAGDPTVVDGIRAFENAEFNRAIEILAPHAEQGDALAQFYLGSVYDFAGFKDRRPGRAAYWFRQAADQRDSQALVVSARIDLSNGLPPDLVVESLAPLVYLGDPAAAYVTATALFPRSRNRAIELFENKNNALMDALSLLDDSAEAKALAGSYYNQVFDGYRSPEVEVLGVRGRGSKLTGTAHAAAANRAKRWALSLLADAAEQGHPQAQQELHSLIVSSASGKRHVRRDPQLWPALAEQRDARAYLEQRYARALLEHRGTHELRKLRQALALLELMPGHAMRENRALVEDWYAEKLANENSRLARATRWCSDLPSNMFQTCRTNAFNDDWTCRFEHKPEHTPDYRTTVAYGDCRGQQAPNWNANTGQQAPDPFEASDPFASDPFVNSRPFADERAKKRALLDGIIAFEEDNDLARAIEILKPLAEGDPLAKHYLSLAQRRLGLRWYGQASGRGRQE